MNQNKGNNQDIHKIIGFCFDNNEQLENFIKKCLKKKKTIWMLNRIKWFIKLSDYQKYDSVKVFFLIALAETNIKLFENRFNDNHEGTEDVRKFFCLFSKKDRNLLTNNFIKLPNNNQINGSKIKYDVIVDILSNVRHRLAHGKNHYDFNFNDDGQKIFNPIYGEFGSINKKQKINYELNLAYNDLKKLIIKNAIKNIKNFL